MVKCIPANTPVEIHLHQSCSSRCVYVFSVFRAFAFAPLELPAWWKQNSLIGFKNYPAQFKAPILNFGDSVRRRKTRLHMWSKISAFKKRSTEQEFSQIPIQWGGGARLGWLSRAGTVLAKCKVKDGIHGTCRVGGESLGPGHSHELGALAREQ